jgi:hypothetical protein
MSVRTGFGFRILRFKNNKINWAIMIALFAISLSIAWYRNHQPKPINSFAECAAAGNPIMESYPERCAANGKTFTNPDQAITQ